MQWNGNKKTFHFKILVLYYHTSMSTYFLWIFPLLHDMDINPFNVFKKKKIIETIPIKGLLLSKERECHHALL